MKKRFDGKKEVTLSSKNLTEEGALAIDELRF